MVYANLKLKEQLNFLNNNFFVYLFENSEFFKTSTRVYRLINSYILNISLNIHKTI